MNQLYADALRSILRPTAPRESLVATRSFNFIDSVGRPYHIEAGQSYYVDFSDKVVARYRGAFRPANGRTVSRPAQRTRQVFTPAFRAEARLKPPTEVRMTWKLRRSLQEEAAAMGDELETGGFLFGRIEPHILGTTTRVQIEGFSGGSRLFSKRTSEMAEFSSAHLREALSQPTIVGDWHTHPARGSMHASEADLGGWGARADQVSWRRGRAPGYIGLILAAGEGQRWIAPAMELRAWFVQPLRYDIPPDEREPKPIPIREVV